MGSTEEPERKRRHLNHSSISPALKKQAGLPSADEKKVDAAMLQYQNQKLEQQLDVQRSEIGTLETRSSQLKSKQALQDASLHSVRNAWGVLLEKLEHLVVRASPSRKGQGSDSYISSKGTRTPSEEDFLHRLLDTGATECSNDTSDVVAAELTLKSCRAAALKSVGHLVRAIDDQRRNIKELCQVLKGKMQDDDGQYRRIDGSSNELAASRLDMDALHLKHKDLAAQVRLWRKSRVLDQAELNVLTGELEETITDLETTRQKISTLRNEKDAYSGKAVSLGGVKSETSENMGENPSLDTKALEGAIEEAKSLASLRLKEFEEVQKEKVRLSEQLHKVQETAEGDQCVTMSKMYAILSEQVEAWRKELEQYHSRLTNISVVEHNSVPEKERDSVSMLEGNQACEVGDMLVEEKLPHLDAKLNDFIRERNALRIRLDETSHALDRQDEVGEFKVMIATLEKEMGMMQQQLDKYKEAACAAELLRAEVESMSLSLENKTNECKLYSDKFADQCLELKALKEEARLLRESEQEVKLILDMYGSESTDSRDLTELQEAECSAWAEVEKLKVALDDHGLELRVKVANEAEEACQQRLAAAETEIDEFMQRLDASERVVLELKEAANMKSEECEAYLSEIETIGQAYEDMQTQNQRLLQQISKRDDYNIKLVSESVKAKQLYTVLNQENQLVLDLIQRATNAVEGHKQRAARSEHQVKVFLDQLKVTKEEGLQAENAWEAVKMKLTEVERESLSTKGCLEVVQKETEQRECRMKEIKVQTEKEKSAKKKAQEELALLRFKLAHTKSLSEGSSLVEKLQAEVKEYKAVLKCGVCHDRPKEVVITKCYHLFCSPCIQRNLEIRHRKCPGCGITFGQSDVRGVHI